MSFFSFFSSCSGLDIHFCGHGFINPIQVAHIAVRAALQSSGQNCAGAERFYVHREIYSSFVSEVAKIVKSVSAVSIFFRHDILKGNTLAIKGLHKSNSTN